MDAVKRSEEATLFQLLDSLCSIGEDAAAHPAGGRFRNKHEIKELGFSIAGNRGFSFWHPLCFLLLSFIICPIPSIGGTEGKRDGQAMVAEDPVARDGSAVLVAQEASGPSCEAYGVDVKGGSPCGAYGVAA